MTHTPVSHLFTKIIQRDYPFYITPQGHFHPTANSIFHYIISSPISDGKLSITSYHIDDRQLQHWIICHYHIYHPAGTGMALHKWALDTFCRQIDTLSNKMPVRAACSWLIDEYEINDDIYSLETLYRTYYKWKKQTDTSDFTLKLVAPPTTADLSRQEALHLAGTAIASHIHIFFTSKHTFRHTLVKIICQYVLHHYCRVKHKDLSQIYHCSPQAIAHNIVSARKFINRHSAFRSSITTLFRPSS